MINNRLELINGFLGGLNLNPIPLELGQSMTTATELAYILAKIDQVITFTNDWYDAIITDLENDGVLYEKLSDAFLTSFGTDITQVKNDIVSINNTIQSLNNLITMLEYVKPSITLSTSPSITRYGVGDTVNSVMLSFNVTKGTNNLVKAEIYKNNSLLTTINNVVNGLNTYVDGTPMTANTTYYVSVFDDKGNVVSNKIDFKFDYKCYYGKVTNETINETLIKGFSNAIFDVPFNANFNLNSEKILIATHDTLTSIIDTENYDMIDSFTKTVVNLTINNVSTPYNVYISTSPIIDNDVTVNIGK